MESALCFSLLILLSSLSLLSSQYFYPDHYFINCGSNAAVSFTGKSFIGDGNSDSISVSGGRAAAQNNNRNPTSIYETARVFTEKSWYELQADQTNTFLIVRLHFSPISSNEFDFSASKFNVSVYGFSVLTNFSVGNATVMEEFVIPIGSEKSFRIEFTPSQGSSMAFVNAIEAFTTPSDLFKDDIYNFTSPLIPIHRINVGGQTITVADDTLRRNWVPDDSFILNSESAKNATYDGQIMYQASFSSQFDAPDNVYNTAKQLNTNSTSITWNFEVNKNTSFLVRAHFCDIISTGFRSPNDSFDFFINNKKILMISPLRTVQQLAAPFYLNFMADSSDLGFINISIRPIENNQQTPFLNGLEIMKLLQGSRRVDQVNEKKNKKMSRNFIYGLSSGIVGIMLLLFMLICWKKRLFWTKRLWETRNATNHQIEMFINNHGTMAPKRYKYSEIMKITNSFLEKLGEGGYGSVYKGQLPDGHLVAVKVLERATGDGEDFINEVASISRTSHVNIVTLLGFCFDGKKRALMYEYMPNGSLDKFLRNDDVRLDWNTLFQISKGIARGLEYLHQGCKTRIVHFDIKPHNILLDEEFVPKISDFGLSKLCKRKESIVSITGARGTAGYIAPEVFFKSFGGASHKYDVYSYGMMVLEMTGVRENNNARATSSSEAYFPDWIYKQVEDGENLGVYGVTSVEDDELARKMMIVSLWCIQSNPSDRPSISNVMEMLEGSLQSLQVPPRRFWSSPTRPPQGSSPLALQSSTANSILTMHIS